MQYAYSFYMSGIKNSKNREQNLSEILCILLHSKPIKLLVEYVYFGLRLINIFSHFNVQNVTM